MLAVAGHRRVIRPSLGTRHEDASPRAVPARAAQPSCFPPSASTRRQNRWKSVSLTRHRLGERDRPRTPASTPRRPGVVSALGPQDRDLPRAADHIAVITRAVAGHTRDREKITAPSASVAQRAAGGAAGPHLGHAASVRSAAATTARQLSALDQRPNRSCRATTPIRLAASRRAARPVAPARHPARRSAGQRLRQRPRPARRRRGRRFASTPDPISRFCRPLRRRGRGSRPLGEEVLVGSESRPPRRAAEPPPRVRAGLRQVGQRAAHLMHNDMP